MTNVDIVVFHDAGEECDDQIALWKLLTELDGAIIKAYVCGKTREIQIERLHNWLAFLYKLNLDKKNLIYNSILSDFQDVGEVKYDAVLQIAPLFGFDTPSIKTNRYVLMGSVDNSVNCPKGSVDLFRRFQGLPGTIVVDSADAAKVRPTKQFIKTIPRVLLVEMIIVGFRLMLCRCNPGEVYAEGLINKNVGRGANFDTNKNFTLAVLGNHEIEVSGNINTEIEAYIESLVKKSAFIEETKKMLYIMYSNLDAVFGFKVPVITASGWVDFMDSDEGIKAFSKFEKVAIEHPEILNPMYDYVAACVLLDSLRIE